MYYRPVTENFSQSATRFGEYLQGKMADKNLSIKELSEQVHSSYEYVRKLCRGLSLPSRYLLAALVPILGLDIEEARKLITADKLTQRFGTFPTMPAQSPELASITRGWDDLTSDQKEILLAQFDAFIRLNKRQRREKAAANAGG
jgi:transcriptional regulator with XRE-family HTH domain